MPCLAIFEIPIIVVVIVKQVSAAGTFIDDMKRFSNMDLNFMGLEIAVVERRVFCGDEDRSHFARSKKIVPSELAWRSS